MKTKTATVIALLLALCIVPVEAGPLSIGGRIGSSHYSGDVLYKSGDVGTGLLLGAHAQLSLLSMLAIEGSAEYFSHSFNYSTDVAGIPLSRDIDFRDVALYATAKLTVAGLPFVPVHLYAGAGPDVHLLNTDVARQVFAGSSVPGESTLHNSARGGYHLVAGAEVGGALLPLGIFAEGRYAKIPSDPKISTRGVYAGFRVGF